jgi:hypothetical protein
MSTPYVALNVGFQKTAAAQIQQALKHNAKALAKDGVQAVHLRDLRQKMGSNHGQNDPSATAKFFSNISKKNTERLVLSDENLLGPFNHRVRTGRLHQHQSPFLVQFAAEAPFPIREVHIAVQDYAAFFAANYVQYIKALKPHNTNFITSRMTCLRVFEQLFGWTDVVETLITYFPHAQIHIWRHEDFTAQPQFAAQVLANLIGQTQSTANIAIPPATAKRGPFSAQAMAALEQCALVEGVRALVSARKDLRAKGPCGPDSPACKPFLPWEQRHLDNLLETDLAKLRSHPAVTFMNGAIS